MVGKLEAVVFDVGHGACILIRTPNERTVLIDPGCTDKFSPSDHLFTEWKTTSVDMMVVTHPHGDHINDMVNVDLYMHVDSLLRNKTMPESMICSGGDKAPEADRTYLVKYHRKYTSKRDWQVSMMNPDYNGGVTVLSGTLDYDPRTPLSANNLSQVIRFRYGCLDLLCPGDIEPAGVALLAEKSPKLLAADDAALEYRVMIAPHHGRDSAASSDLIKLFNPHLAVICDEHGVKTTNDDFYRYHCTGLRVYRKSTDTVEEKCVLTTKTNDYVYLRADDQNLLVQVP